MSIAAPELPTIPPLTEDNRMSDPVTLAAVAGTILTEGIKFLYGQAAEALKRWRDEKDKATRSDIVSAQISNPAIFDGTLEPLTIHVGQLEALRGLSGRVSGDEP